MNLTWSATIRESAGTVFVQNGRHDVINSNFQKMRKTAQEDILESICVNFHQNWTSCLGCSAETHRHTHRHTHTHTYRHPRLDSYIFSHKNDPLVKEKKIFGKSYYLHIYYPYKSKWKSWISFKRKTWFLAKTWTIHIPTILCYRLQQFTWTSPWCPKALENRNTYIHKISFIFTWLSPSSLSAVVCLWSCPKGKKQRNKKKRKSWEFILWNEPYLILFGRRKAQCSALENNGHDFQLIEQFNLSYVHLDLQIEFLTSNNFQKKAASMVTLQIICSTVIVVLKKPMWKQGSSKSM